MCFAIRHIRNTTSKQHTITGWNRSNPIGKKYRRHLKTIKKKAKMKLLISTVMWRAIAPLSKFSNFETYNGIGCKNKLMPIPVSYTVGL